jgi:hypothetical protein
MATLFKAHSSDKVRAILGMLEARGFDVRDFELREEAHSGVSQLLGMSGGIVTVRRRSTGELRVYACGEGSAWFATISGDLDREYFRATRDAAVPLRPRFSLAGAWRG